MKMNLIPKVKTEKTRYRVIRIDNFFIILDCLEGKIYHPFHKAWEAEKFIEKINLISKTIIKPRSIGFSTKKLLLPLGKRLSTIFDFQNHKDFRAIAEAKSEFDGKIKGGKASVDSALWTNMLLEKRKNK